MWVMTRAEFDDIQTLAQQLIVKEYAQLPICMLNDIPSALQGQTERYGYGIYTMCFCQQKYVFTYRDFHLTPVKVMPAVPELEIRRQAEQYEVQRQRMGYVTKLQLDLAEECIKTGRIQIKQTGDRGYLTLCQTIYGLYWLEYENDCQYFDELEKLKPAKIRKCRNEQFRLRMMKSYRLKILRGEEIFRLKDVIEKKHYEPPRFVKDYMRINGIPFEDKGSPEASKQSNISENTSIINRVFGYFSKGPLKGGKHQEENIKLKEAHLDQPYAQEQDKKRV